MVSACVVPAYSLKYLTKRQENKETGDALCLPRDELSEISSFSYLLVKSSKKECAVTAPEKDLIV